MYVYNASMDRSSTGAITYFSNSLSCNEVIVRSCRQRMVIAVLLLVGSIFVYN
jgi:hypothetical protein